MIYDDWFSTVRFSFATPPLHWQEPELADKRVSWAYRRSKVPSPTPMDGPPDASSTEGENSQQRETPLQFQQRELQRESSSASDVIPIVPSPAYVRFVDNPSRVPTPVPSVPPLPVPDPSRVPPPVPSVSPLPVPDPPDLILRRSSRVRRERKILTPNDPSTYLSLLSETPGPSLGFAMLAKLCHDVRND